ncbi:hypothetical protein KC333_g7846, partial [Hortaea werneckii]
MQTAAYTIDEYSRMQIFTYYLETKRDPGIAPQLDMLDKGRFVCGLTNVFLVETAPVLDPFQSLPEEYRAVLWYTSN